MTVETRKPSEGKLHCVSTAKGRGVAGCGEDEDGGRAERESDESRMRNTQTPKDTLR